MMLFEHTSVLLEDVLEALSPADGEIMVDCTLGGGGHTEALLERADCTVIGMDRDPSAIEAASERLAHFGNRFVPQKARFSEIERILDELELPKVNGIFADLGVSSPQLDRPERGFSFRAGGPIDMRMDPTQAVAATELVNEWTEEALSQVIREYGEEPRARRIARAIVAGRPWRDTAELADAIAAVAASRNSRIHPATRVFQALRIAVNDELGELKKLLPSALSRLAEGGRLVIISFHSLEDRIVKSFMARESGKTAPKDGYGDPIGDVRLVDVHRCMAAEGDPNPRARSARLRWARRCA
jgi:16S rRNA (cytosine1402-N4)-methyltransferase